MEIKINGRKWQVLLVDEENKALCNDDESITCGITHFQRNKIYINETIEETLMRDTIIHELTHAYLFVYGFGQVESYTEEMVCDAMGAFGYDLIQNAIKIFNEFAI